jgi:hypothetical protein
VDQARVANHNDLILAPKRGGIDTSDRKLAPTFGISGRQNLIEPIEGVKKLAIVHVPHPDLIETDHRGQSAAGWGE